MNEVERHFFQEAPTFSWISWIWRSLFQGSAEPPRLLKERIQTIPYRPKNKIQIQKAVPEAALDYSTLLHKYFVLPQDPIELWIPPPILKAKLESKVWIGVEARDSNKRLVGCVFHHFTGEFLGEKTGLVTWLCIAPSFRKQGLASQLLFALYEACLPIRLHWWRNDGLLKSPAPPIFTSSYISRKRHSQRTILQGQRSLLVHRVPLAKWRSEIEERWCQQNPQGIFLADSQGRTDLEIYEARFTPTCTAVLFIQPTYEFQRDTKEQWCEVVAWIYTGLPQQEYNQAQLYEAMLDQLPYGWFWAPQSMPHLENGSWKPAGQSVWSCIGLDPGSPVTRAILPLCAC
jgi:GNAT superfamily N-acetyltransferase